MTDPTADPGIMAKAVEYLWAGVLALVGIIYKVNDKKLEKIDERIEHEVRCVRVELRAKADSDDIKKALRHIETLFEKAEDDRKDTRDRYDALNQRITDTHLSLLGKIAEIQK